MRPLVVGLVLAIACGPRGAPPATTDSGVTAGTTSSLAARPTSPEAPASTPPDSSARSPFDSVLSRTHDGEDECLHYADYTVAVNDLDSVLGQDVFVRSGPDASCGFDSLPGDFVLRTQWAEYYFGKIGNTLLIDSGTGIVREAIFWDIKERKKYYSGGYTDTEYGGPPGTIGSWRKSPLAPPAKGCPVGSQSIVEQVTWVVVATGAEQMSDRYRCGYEE